VFITLLYSIRKFRASSAFARLRKQGKIWENHSKKIKNNGKYSKIIKNFQKSHNPLSVLLLYQIFRSPLIYSKFI